MIEIRKSKIHGNGVFATKDIKRGEIITKYPQHFKYTGDTNFEYDTDEFVSDLKRSGNSEFIKLLETEDIEEVFKKFCMRTGYGYRLGDRIGNMFIIDDMSNAGHLINDFCCINFKNKITEKDIKRYVILSAMESNVMFNEDNVIAIRDIKKNEELYVPYGIKYWVKINDQEVEEDIMTKCEEFFKTQFILNLRIKNKDLLHRAGTV